MNAFYVKCSYKVGQQPRTVTCCAFRVRKPREPTQAAATDSSVGGSRCDVFSQIFSER